ncbi:MAG: hypothetical protein IPF53_10785 [Blastocatellia bacterium]|nr:hypothetical protein [Blastocatellia bacterium]MBK6427987.1 hypothetical protein [Blastocatellia bacterium]
MYNPNPSQYPPPGGFTPGYGGPPPPSSYGTPGVVTWFKVYAALMALVYLLLMGLGIFMVVAGASLEGMEELQGDASPIVIGVIYAIMGLVFAIVFAVGLFLPRKPWGWIMGIVLIALGMTSVCCLPATIPLLIFWLKPDAKAYFGRV